MDLPLIVVSAGMVAAGTVSLFRSARIQLRRAESAERRIELARQQIHFHADDESPHRILQRVDRILGGRQ